MNYFYIKPIKHAPFKRATHFNGSQKIIYASQYASWYTLIIFYFPCNRDFNWHLQTCHENNEWLARFLLCIYLLRHPVIQTMLRQLGIYLVESCYQIDNAMITTVYF